MGLLSQVKEYLGEADYTLQNPPAQDLVLATRSAIGGKENMLVWLPRTMKNQSQLDEIDDTFSSPQYRNARRCILVPTTAGLTRDFRRDAQLLGSQILVPVQFFDTPFKIEEAPNAASVIASLRDQAKEHRVPQPYAMEGQPGGDDLLPVLHKKFTRPLESSLRIVVGPAGSGKSQLFSSLFGRLYDDFLEGKKRQRTTPRPIPLLPEHLKGRHTIRTNDLIDAFLRTDVASPVRQETLEWMLVNGFCTWLFDGLDELYSSDDRFFDYVLDLLTRPNTKAQILICARNSLLTTNDALAQFIQEYQQAVDSPVEVYRLKEWENDSKRKLTWLRLKKRLPKGGESDTEDVAGFMNYISKVQPLKQISKTPYYCNLLLDEYQIGTRRPFEDEFSVLQHAVNGIVKREIDKGLISLNHFGQNGQDLYDWLETAALEAYRSNYEGLLKEELEEYARVVIQSDLEQEEIESIVTSLIQFPLFIQGKRHGTISFQHELMAEYLAAKYIVAALRKNTAKAVGTIEDKANFAESLTCRYFVKEFENDKSILASIERTVLGGSLNPKSFSHLLQILVIANPRTDLLKRNSSLLEGKDLQGLVFEDLDLDNVSFRHTNLKGVRFVKCSLQKTKFENALLSETHFENINENSLRDANFSALQRCESIWSGGKRISEREALKEWIQEVTKVRLSIEDPCPTAMQLEVLFKKFVGIDGTNSRDNIPSEAIARGKRIKGAPDPGECAKKCVAYGYLQGPDDRGRYNRIPGDKYDHMVDFVQKNKASDTIRAILDELCSIQNCRHLPTGIA